MKNLREKLEYHQEKDYLVPNIAIKNNFFGISNILFLLEGTLLEHIVAIDKEANKQVRNIIKNLAKANNVDEMLKERSPFEWVRLMNNFKNTAEEIVLKELIYN